MSQALLTVRITHEHEVVSARQRARELAEGFGFEAVEQTRIATAVSEIARNAFVYARGGHVDFLLEGATAPQLFVVRVRDEGGGIAHLADVMHGRYQSRTGMGLGMIGSKRLVDRFDVQTGSSGTVVTLRKMLPKRAGFFTPARLAQLTEDLSRRHPTSPLEVVTQQNQELLRTLEALESRRVELERVNRELEDTNRGVVALYAELDERADHLRSADEMKTRFLSNMTHEFRTPLNSILALTNLLRERLAAPQEEKDELFYIRRSAQQLSDLVDDLLDIAKVEAGKVEISPAAFEVAGLFGALRGMLRPLLLNQSLNLVFDEPAGIPPLVSDESKISQVLRNFISNALKYTEQGEVRVTAAVDADRGAVTFAVADTGIGIPAHDLARIFDEFVQIENPLQRRRKGTGLGLPLSRRLAELLGGRIGVESALGIGSTFTLTIPLVHPTVGREGAVTTLDPARTPLLIVEDADEDYLIYERIFTDTDYQVVPARSVAAARTALDAMRPAAIILDLRLQGDDAWDLLTSIKRSQATASIPVIVVSTLADRDKGIALGADAYAIKPADRGWLLETLDRAILRDRRLRVLHIDDEEAARFVVRGLLQDDRYVVREAQSGADGLAMIASESPDVIVLDLRLGDMTGLDLLERLRGGGVRLPTVVLTSQTNPDGVAALTAPAVVLSKAQLTRDRLRQAIADVIAADAPFVPNTR